MALQTLLATQQSVVPLYGVGVLACRTSLTLSEALLAAATAATAYDPAAWIPGTLISQCGPVSFAIQRLRGGDILQGRLNGVPHLWNLLPDGQEIDYTKQGIPTDGRWIRQRKTVNPRFKLFWNRLIDVLYYGTALR